MSRRPPELDAAWAANVRAALLLVRAFARQYWTHEQHRLVVNAGRVLLFTSGAPGSRLG